MSISAFLDAMQSAGVSGLAAPIADGDLHRFTVAGDKPRSDNGWYVLHQDGDFLAGAFGSWKSGANHTWHSKENSRGRISQAQKASIAASREKAEAAARERQEETAEVAGRIWQSSSEAPADFLYFVGKGISAGVARYDSAKACALIPIRDASRGLVNLQRIYPDGTKRFLSGGRIKGCYCSLVGEPDRILICEGYATGVTLHQATGWSVAVAFNAGNLEPVARALRERYPDKQLTVAADNDHETEGNPGIRYAREAAEACAGDMLAPEGIEGTDWNDYAAERGIAAVTLAFEERDDGRAARNVVDHGDGISDHGDHDSYASYRGVDADLLPASLGSPIPLGYDSGSYYYLSQDTLQVECLSAAAHTQRNLQHLAGETYYWTRSRFMGKQRVDWDAAADWLMQSCRDVGIFDPDRIRGRGAWLDAGRSVLHFGDRLHVDGLPVRLSEFRSRYLYPRGRVLLDETPEPLATTAAHRLVKICEMLSWRDPIHARLLAGFIALSPICGALDWRPSIWLTGGSGSGKSWVYEKIISASLGAFKKFVSGSTTEPGLRRMLGSDAIPVVFEESEANREQDAERIRRILFLVRNSSTQNSAAIVMGGGGNGGVEEFRIRSMFAFSSIQVNIEDRADESRITVLTLGPSRRDQEWVDLQDAVAATITPDFSAGLIMRSAALMPVIRHNAAVFSQSVAKTFGDQRSGDQLGALLAGAYSLHSDRQLTVDKADAWIHQNGGLRASTVADAESDEERFLAYLREAVVRYERTAGGMSEKPLGEIMVAAASSEADDKVLARFGIKYQHVFGDYPPAYAMAAYALHGPDGYGFWIGHAHNGLARVLAQSPWRTKWEHQLQRVRGAVVGDHPIRIGEVKKRATFVPYAAMMG